MDILMSIIFVVTAFVSLSLIMIVIGRGSINVPGVFGIEALEPATWYIFYPSMFYQIYFWAIHFSIIPGF